MTATTHTDQSPLDHLSNSTTLPTISTVALRIAYWGMIWSDRRNSRRELAKLSPEHCNDVGLSTIEAAKESQKPFWRP